LIISYIKSGAAAMSLPTDFKESLDWQLKNS
jgi:hypothetical protein